uniref:HTH OST-type domain-containing protein n=1 Tax=Anopheles dirus TaxID=7168 RepID=A0A182NTJ3_9DIPT
MEALKPLIRALANSNAGGMTVGQLDRDFQSTEGTTIPFRECGFPSLEAMLRSMSDTVTVTTTRAGAVIYPTLTAETQHIRNMVLKSKKNKKKQPAPHAYKPNNNFGASSGYTARLAEMDPPPPFNQLLTKTQRIFGRW